MTRLLRPLLFVAAIAGLVVGLLSGLARLGVGVPAFAVAQLGNHGALMICGLFGTLISLERAVAMARGWPYWAPGLAALGSVALLSGHENAAQLLYIAAASVLLAASLRLWLQQSVLHLATLALAALMWLFGNLLWLGSGAVITAVPAWQAFLVLTIAGERLELSRFLPTPASARRLFAVIVIAIALGAQLLPITTRSGSLLFGAALMALVLWLLRHDIVRRTIRQTGLPRFIAVCLLSGYLWLLLSALLMLGGALLFTTPLRDAALHSMLLGFVFSMVFGHAPVILPAVARLKLPYHPVLYLPLTLLQLSLLVRVWSGMNDDFVLRQQAALGNAGALLVFVACVLTLILRARRAA